MIVLSFKTYTLELYEEEGAVKADVTPTPSEKDKASIAKYFLDVLSDISTPAGEWYADIRMKPKRKDYLERIKTIYNKVINSVLDQYPSAEITGWTTKSFQAEQWLSANDSEKEILKTKLTMLISESVSNSNADITDLATRIKAKSDAYQAFHGIQTKIKNDLEEKIKNAKTDDDLKNIDSLIKSQWSIYA